MLILGWYSLFNLQATFVFHPYPEKYISRFELEGAVRTSMLRGLGVLFVIWNFPYAMALWYPIHHLLFLYEALSMVTIGYFREAIIFTKPPGIYSSIKNESKHQFHFKL